MDPGTIALVGTLLGGPVVVKVVDSILSRGQKQVERDLALREELRKDTVAMRTEIAALKAEVRTAEKELDTWKEKYFVLLQDYLALKGR